MGSISFVEGKWRALIRRKGFGSVSKRFDTKSKAAAWMRDIEGQIISGSQKKEVVKSERTMGKVIDAYIRLRAQNRPILDTSTEHYTLKTLKNHLGDIPESALSIDDLIVFAQKRRDEGAGAYTVNCDPKGIGKLLHRQTKPILLRNDCLMHERHALPFALTLCASSRTSAQSCACAYRHWC